MITLSKSNNRSVIDILGRYHQINRWCKRVARVCYTDGRQVYIWGSSMHLELTSKKDRTLFNLRLSILFRVHDTFCIIKTEFLTLVIWGLFILCTECSWSPLTIIRRTSAPAISPAVAIVSASQGWKFRVQSISIHILRKEQLEHTIHLTRGRCLRSVWSSGSLLLSTYNGSILWCWATIGGDDGSDGYRLCNSMRRALCRWRKTK